MGLFEALFESEEELKVVHNRFGPKNCLDFLGHQSYNQEHGEKNRKRSITAKPGA